MLRKWRFAVKLIMCGRCLLAKHIKTCDFPDTPYFKQVEQIDQCASLGINRDHCLFFDPSDFKANKQMRMSAEAKRILTKRPEYRTQQEIYYAMIALRNVSTIADFPVRMQMKLAQFGSFQSFDSKRIVVRQGDPPYAFYFILYGTVIVCILNEDKKEARTVCFLHRGDSFGELAIVNQSARQSTVICKEYIEMLVISDEAYERIFMVGGSRTINDPDHEKFMRGLKFLDGWPSHLLTNDPKTFVFSFFKRDAILTRDTNLTEWIFIVKSGSVDVLKKLVRMKPIINAKNGTISVRPQRPDPLTIFRNNLFQKYPPKESTASRLSGGMDEPDEKIKNGPDVLYDDSSCDRDSVSIRPQTMHALRAKRKMFGAQGSPCTLARPKTSMNKLKSDPVMDSFFQKISGQRQKRQSRKPSLSKVTTDVLPRADTDDPGERRTFLDDLDAAAKNQERELTEADIDPQFVRVRTLTKGSVFGLENVVFDNQPSMYLVSNGSECMLLNKKFYLDNCPANLLRSLRTQISPYPTDDDLNDKLQTRLNWDAYKKAVLSDVINRGRNRKKHTDIFHLQPGKLGLS